MEFKNLTNHDVKIYSNASVYSNRGNPRIAYPREDFQSYEPKILKREQIPAHIVYQAPTDSIIVDGIQISSSHFGQIPRTEAPIIDATMYEQNVAYVVSQEFANVCYIFGLYPPEILDRFFVVQNKILDENHITIGCSGIQKAFIYPMATLVNFSTNNIASLEHNIIFYEKALAVSYDPYISEAIYNLKQRLDFLRNF